MAGLKQDSCQERPYWPRVSLCMAVQLYGRHYGRDDYYPILDELDALEGRWRRRSTKEEAQFKCAPLAPFYHKHYFSAKHMVTNLGVRWGVHEGRQGNRDLLSMIECVAIDCGETPAEWQSKLSYEFVMAAYVERAQQRRLTGDWIIFHKHNGENYYLAVVDHCVRGRENDQSLYDWLHMSCAWEYPFLF